MPARRLRTRMGSFFSDLMKCITLRRQIMAVIVYLTIALVAIMFLALSLVGLRSEQ